VDWRREALLYVIHGCLHLCGYDDRTPTRARRMRREQARLLNELCAWRVIMSRRGAENAE
jgi:rRNA maturation RNase YbeY